jgi:Cu/Ag efflux pump CusA
LTGAHSPKGSPQIPPSIWVLGFVSMLMDISSELIHSLLPVLLVSRGVGAETQRPPATVIVGGLITSTALTLLLLPLMYEWLAGYGARRQNTERGQDA